MDKHTIFQQIKKNTEQEASNPRTKDNLPTNTQSGAGSYNFHSAQVMQHRNSSHCDKICREKSV